MFGSNSVGSDAPPLGADHGVAGPTSQFGPDDVTLFMWQAEQDSVVDLVSVGIGSKNL